MPRAKRPIDCVATLIHIREGTLGISVQLWRSNAPHESIVAGRVLGPCFSTPRFYMRTLLYLRYFRLQLRALFDRTLSFRFTVVH